MTKQHLDARRRSRLAVVLIGIGLVATMPGCRKGPVASYRPRGTPTATVVAEETPAATFGALDAPVEDPAASPGAAPRPGAQAPARARPRLGSLSSSFTDTLGPANRKRVGTQVFLGFDRCRGRETETFGLLVTVSDGRAVSILRQLCRGTIDPAEAEREARPYFPLDASGEGAEVRNEDGQPARAFISSALAQAVPADWFTDCDDNLVEAGTFSLLIVRDGWTLDTGVCPS